MIRIKNLTIKHPYKKSPILDSISLDINDGDFITVIGTNGSGKSSLFNAIYGRYLPSSGSIESSNEKISYLGQDLTTTTFSSLTVRENMQLSAKIPYLKVLESINPELLLLLDAPAKELSGGLRQALATAICLVQKPTMLLLDEHTSALDPARKKQLLKKTASYIATNRITTMMITHTLDDAIEYGNRLIALKDGKIVLDTKKKNQIHLPNILNRIF